MEQAPLCQSFTSLYLRCAMQPSTSQEGVGNGRLGAIGCVCSPVGCDHTEIGTENVMSIRRSSEPSVAGTFVVDIQRYIVGGAGVWLLMSSPSSMSSCPFPTPGVGRSSAVDNALRLPLPRDCFLSRRLMVSAFAQCESLHVRGEFEHRTFSSSSFFSERFLRFLAVSSRFKAISSSVKGFFFRGFGGSAGVTAVTAIH